ncbi:OsmC family protein [Rhodococcus globerulus]|uniref:OsmC family protein n=1 Tax=Rhodococcus globerulus TaxID=33008 RepID=A0ABU4C3Y9_RHOGO|nr:OsmC family protein [Rhodococcus globerulus]MDV6271220.1 OsmC family protein [Rhodococcus globerulus]
MTAPVVVAVGGHTIPGIAGRYLLNARTNHLVTDSRMGPAEAVTAGELLLAAIASCAMSNIQANAEADGIPVTDVSVTASHRRGEDDPTMYDFHRLDIAIHGVDQADANALASKFVASCPIYNTIRRGGGIELVVTAVN